MSPVSTDITVDAREVVEALDRLADKDARGALQAATKEGAKPLKAGMQAEAPVGKTKRVRRSISATGARRDKPGMVVRPRPKVAPHRHLVALGTAERFSRSGASRGVMPANPFVSRTADRHGERALDITERKLADLLDLD